MVMTKENFKEIGKRLATAFRLSTRPLAVYGSGILSAVTVQLPDINRCLTAVYRSHVRSWHP